MGKSRWWRVMAAAAVGVVMAAAGLVLPVRPAAAAVSGLEKVRAVTPSDSVDVFKAVNADCPAGKKVLGGGGAVRGGFGQVMPTRMSPNSDLTRWTVAGQEDQDGTDDQWFVEAEAICAVPPPGLELVTAESPISSQNKRVTAHCPDGKSVVGAGADLHSRPDVHGQTAFGEVVLDEIRPDSTLTFVAVHGREDADGTTLFWSVQAYAICADPLPGLERIVKISPLDSDDKRTFPPEPCPTGKKVVGAGGDLLTSLRGEVIMYDVNVATLLTDVVVHAAEDQGGAEHSWAVRAYTICATE